MSNLKDINGIQWNYEVKGEGEPLLFIHGWGVDGRIWKQQIKHFCGQYQVITVDLPGHGQTIWHETSTDDMSRNIKLILDDLKAHGITIIGSSLGGLVGLKFYENFPNSVKRLIFVGSMPKFTKSEDYPYGLEIEKMKKLESQLDSDFPAIMHVFFRSLFTKEERATRRYKWMMKFKRTDKDPERSALSQYINILEKEDLRYVLKEVIVPVLFINGEQDYICCQKAVVFLKELVPHARFSNFERCGHFPFLSRPYEFNYVLEEFLNETKRVKR